MTQQEQHRVVVVSKEDFPLSCPMPGDATWNAHPRVYLTFPEGEAIVHCPYCGTEYRFEA